MSIEHAMLNAWSFGHAAKQKAMTAARLAVRRSRITRQAFAIQPL
jgi:hypothetical protein